MFISCQISCSQQKQVTLTHRISSIIDRVFNFSRSPLPGLLIFERSVVFSYQTGGAILYFSGTDKKSWLLNECAMNAKEARNLSLIAMC